MQHHIPFPITQNSGGGATNYYFQSNQLSFSPPLAIAAAITRFYRCPDASSLTPSVILMIGGDEQVMPAAWTASELQWYADFVVHCSGQRSDAPAVSAVLELDALPLEECLFMRGDAELDGRFEDSASQLWSQDRHGRWFAKINRRMVWLQCKLAQLRYRRAPRRVPKQRGPKRVINEVVSHICGNCNCIRLQHIRYQSKSDDARDRAHHRAHGCGIRPDVLARIAPKPLQTNPDSTDFPEREMTPRSISRAPRLRAPITHATP